MGKLEERLAEKKAKEAAEAEKVEVFDADLVPEQTRERSESDLAIDHALDGVDILEAYRRWCGKSNPDPKGMKEGIKVSCPIPGHADKDPSAWINTDEQVWYCGRCSEGGDKFDIAAYHFGYPVPGYKEGASFPKLREEMALSLGVQITRIAGGEKVVTLPEEGEESSNVVQLHSIEGDDDDEDDPDNFQLELGWRNIVPEDTFLRAYLEACSKDNLPEEYHFWCGMIALGLAIGRDIQLDDDEPVLGNLFVCLLGRSGSGKSRASRHLKRLIDLAIPYDESNPASKGARYIPSAGSGESLVDEFIRKEKDLADPFGKKMVEYPVTGCIYYNELSAISNRTNRTGNTLRDILMEIFDGDEKIGASARSSGGRIIARNAFGSMLTTSQPKALRGLLTRSDESAGWVNRIIFAPGIEKARRGVAAARSGSRYIDLSATIAPLQKIRGDAAGFSGSTGSNLMDWSDEAMERHDDFLMKVVDRDQKGQHGDILSRVDLTIKKLILLFAVNSREKIVSTDSVDCAIKVYPYLKAAYGIPETQIGTSDLQIVAQKIEYQVDRLTKKSGQPPTVAVVQNALKSSRIDNTLFRRALDDLLALQILEYEPPRKRAVGDIGRTPSAKRLRRVT